MKWHFSLCSETPEVVGFILVSCPVWSFPYWPQVMHLGIFKEIKTLPNLPVMWLFFHSYFLIDPKAFLSDHIGLTWQRCPQNAKLTEKGPWPLIRAILPCTLSINYSPLADLGLLGYLTTVTKYVYICIYFSPKLSKVVKTLWWKQGGL